MIRTISGARTLSGPRSSRSAGSPGGCASTRCASARSLATTLSLGEPELANVTYGGGDPEVYKRLPAAVDAALRPDYAPLQRLVAADKLRALGYLSFDVTQISFAGQAATTCHDYARPFSLADTARAAARRLRPRAREDRPGGVRSVLGRRVAEHGHRGGTEVP